ncbi:MAG: hypothetical protein NZ529_09590 [Cytophagaceae bacterium]|nr:hypothetical protein [Cytophagaceae bacterium]MDW8457038.1 hypothetical protein [Cytophagaceae bacterium]
MIKKFKFRHSIEVGLSFGLTSGVITTVGLMVGVYSGTQSKAAVLASIFTIAISDAMSDALGIHIAEESENVHSQKEIWVATLTTFLSKFVVSSSFVLPLLILDIQKAVIVNILYGIVLITVYNFWVGKKQPSKTLSIILEHLFIAIVVVVVSYWVGTWIKQSF